MKRIVFFALLGIVLCAGCNDSGSAGSSADSTLTFVHLNDTYRIDAVEDGNRGGFARVATIVNDLKEEGRDVYILHGGDFLYPSLESQIWNGEQMVEAFNYLDSLAPMFVVPGNHEFDPRTPDAVIDAMRASRFDWLGDNLDLDTGQQDVDDALRKAFTFNWHGKSIGIFSLTLLSEDGGNVRDYAIVSGDYIETAETLIESFRSAGVDLVFGLTHLHMTDDLRIAALRRQFPNFLFIVGGHEHEPEHASLSNTNAAVMKGASNARTIWQIDVRFGDDGAVPEMDATMIAVDRTVQEDTAYLAISDKWRQKLLELIPFLPSRIGTAAVPMDSREVTVRNVESNWGNFIADQMPRAFRDPPAELAIINSGTLRIDDMIAGDITFEDVGRTFGFSSFLRHMTISGGDFKTLMEAGYRGSGPSKGYFPQISGFRICVDRSRPDGARVAQLQVPTTNGWQPIEDGRDYTLVAPDFIYRGGDGYDFSNARNVSRPGSELRYLVLDAVIRAQAEGRAVGKPVDPENPRIAFLQSGQASCFD